MEEITKSHDKITESREIVGQYEFSIEGLDKPLKIKIIKYGENKFNGLTNLKVKGGKGASFYQSLAIKDTKEEALKDGLSGFFAFYSEDAEIEEVKDW